MYKIHEKIIVFILILTFFLEGMQPGNTLERILRLFVIKDMLFFLLARLSLYE